MIEPVDKGSPRHGSIDVVTAIEWLSANDDAWRTRGCPTCGDNARKRPILRAPWPNGGAADAHATLLECGCCGSAFFYPTSSVDYGADPTGGGGALAFYLQQGAGLWSITANLTDLHRPAGTRFLEIGCGFGFALDFARRSLGWEVLGLDPSPFAAAGRAAFGLPIESRYLVEGDTALAGRFDVIMGSEVLEHVASPTAFVRTLWTVLGAGGTLVLTTPDVDAVRPDTPHGLLVPLLSIGYHLVLQSKRSLELLLRDAGFDAVEVRQSGASLMARCRRKAETAASTVDDPKAPRHQDLYRRYLCDAAAAVAPDGDLWFGLTARAYRQAVNVPDRPRADALWDGFAAACWRRFTADPEALAAQPDDPDGQSLDGLAAREPLCLGPVLLHRAYHRMLSGEARRSVEPLFRNAATACSRLRRALQTIGSDDGDAENAGWVARAEALLCAAEHGAADVPEQFVALGSSPTDLGAGRDGLPLQTDGFRRRLFVSLVNAGRLDDADRLAEVVVRVEARGALPGVLLADDELDVLFCAAARELQRPDTSAARRALHLLELLRSAGDAVRAAGRAGSAVALIGPALDAEILALDVLGRTADANRIRKAVEDEKARTRL